jgi:RNA polymerase sigma-70 factor (ECF subfamily)
MRNGVATGLVPSLSTAALTRDELETELEQLHPASFAWALACCRWDRSDAEDVWQSACLRAFDGSARFNGDASVRTWFFGVVRNTASERRRTRLIRGDAWLRFLRREPEAEPEPTPERISNRTEICDRVRRVLSRLSPRQRETLHLVFYHELTVEQAAEVLRIPVGTARTHYKRGKTRMRRMLAADGDER